MAQRHFWKNVTHVGHGLHPDPATAHKAAHVQVKHLRKLDYG